VDARDNEVSPRGRGRTNEPNEPNERTDVRLIIQSHACA